MKIWSSWFSKRQTSISVSWRIHHLIFARALEIGEDTTEGKDFLKCEYNNYGDSFRSPWTNQYFPAIESGEGEEDVYYPTADLLEME